ncbi:MAG: PDZ domain-containing protein [Gammaproteobacteria bacterium]|nr:PDZ domain-containing protein [Gammaproteobacteria bacterium]
MKVPAAIDHLIIPIRVLILAGLAYAVVLAVQFFFFGAGIEETDLEDLTDFSPPSEVSVGSIIRANLFGELPKQEVAQVIEETTLNFKLIGISYNSENPAMSRAYIVGRTKAKAVRCGVGERVDGVEVTDIFEDHVLLQRSGRKESLYVEQREQLIDVAEQTTFAPETPDLPEGLIAQTELADSEDSEDSTATSPEGWVRQYFDTHRERIEKEPEAVLTEMGISPVAEESAAGYRLHESMAERLGLRTGDILLTVNGHRVGNVQDDLAQLTNQLDVESLKLEIQRGETKITLNYTPNQ